MKIFFFVLHSSSRNCHFVQARAVNGKNLLPCLEVGTPPNSPSFTRSPYPNKVGGEGGGGGRRGLAE